MRPTTREVLQKADIAVANLQASGGYLNPEQANAFIDLVIDSPTLLREVRQVRMNSPQRLIEKVGFSSRILRAAPISGQALDAADRAAPTTEKIQLNTKEVMAEVHLPYDVLEDNIEREDFEATIMRHIADRVALDLEELLVKGDTSAADPYLALLDGVIAQASSHVIQPPTADTAMKKTRFRECIIAMPDKYLRSRREFRFWVSYDNEMIYRDTLADRETGLGDTMVEGYRPVWAYGIPVVPAAMVDNSYVIFTHPKNIVWGVQRQIQVETDKSIRERVYVIVVTMRIDMKFETEDAVVIMNGITNA